MPQHAATSAAMARHLSADRDEGAGLETQTGPTRADRLVPLPENVLSLSVERRSWNGVSLDVISARCQGRVAHHLCYESHTRLAALLEEVGSPCEPRLREHEPCAMPYVPRHLYFVPAGVPVWGYSADMRFVRDAVLTFDLDTVRQYLKRNLAGDLSMTPRLRFGFADAVHFGRTFRRLIGAPPAAWRRDRAARARDPRSPLITAPSDRTNRRRIGQCVPSGDRRGWIHG